MKRFLLSFLVLFVMGAASAQVTVFTDNFNSSTGASYTAAAGPIGTSTTWSLSLSGTDWGAKIDNSILDLTNDASGAGNAIGWCFGYTPTASFAAPYTPTLNTNVGVVTWTFNMRQPRADPAGFSSGNYGVAFVLGATSLTAATAGNGYAVVLGNAGSVDPIRLARYTTGLQGTITDIITSSGGFADIGTEYLSIKVTYTPSTDTWELFLRDDLGVFADPAAGVLISQGTAPDATYTGGSLDYLGGYWQGSTTPIQTAYFDNSTVTVTYPNTITTGAVTGAPFTLVDCITPGPGTVAFTSTDVFGGANTFTAQLSDDIGSFASPINIGSLGPLGGTAPSGIITISIPAGTVSGTGYRIRVVSDNPAITGSSSAAFQVIQIGLCGSSHTDYYRSVTSGDWSDPTTWESSTDNLIWLTPATLAPTFNANTILISNGHTVTIAADASADQLTIQSGGILNHSNGIVFTLNNNVSGTDMIINSAGIYVLNGTQPTGTGTIDVLSGAFVRVDANPAPTESDDFAYGNGNVTFRTGSIFDWNTNLYTPEWSGRIYFTITESPTYRFSQTPNFTLGGGTLTIIYGILEANSAITIVGAGTKTFTNGIIGTGNIDASTAGSGEIIIDGTTSVLGGGTLTLQTGVPLRINGSTASMTSSKTIMGDINLSGNSTIVLGAFDLTVSGYFSGYGTTAYVQTNGAGYLKILTVTGPRAFPVGYSSWNLVNINNGNSADFSVRVEDGINPPISFPTYGINRTWNIFASANTSAVEVGFQYATADANPGVNPGVDLMEVLLYSLGAWSVTPNNTNITPTGANPWLVTTTATGTLTISTTPVPYVLGKSGGWILPIECIISTRAQKRNNTGIISWTVNSCSDVSNFEVQRSVNNSGFRTIGIVDPVVNQTDFNFTDAALAGGTNLYRIKVNGFATGSSKYSNTVAIIHNSNDLLITTLAPNPVHNSALLTISTGRASVVSFKVYNMSGGLVRQWQSNIAEGNNVIEMNVSELAPGVYTLFASNKEAKTVSRFVKQ